MRLNLKQKSVILVAGVALVLLAAYSIFGFYYVEQTTQGLLAARVAQARATAEELDRLFDRAGRKLERVAEQPLLVHGLEAQVRQRENGQLPAAETLHYILWEFEELPLVFLVDHAGRILWRETPAVELIDRPFEPFPDVQRAIAARPDYPSVLALTAREVPDASGPQLLVVAPLLSDGMFEGALVGAIPLDHERIVNAIQTMDDGSAVQLVAPDGMVVASTDPSRNMQGLPYAESLSTGVESGLLRPDGFEDSVVVAARLPGNPEWAVAIDQKRDKALSAARHLTGILVTFGAVLILLLMAVLFFILRSFTKPVEVLTADARRIAAGDLDVQFDSGRTDEVGVLASALDEMKCKLKASYERLLISEKMALMGQLVAGIAHELNNPLTIVVGHTDLLLHTGVDEKKKETLTRIREGAVRASKIVRNLLTFARQEKPERKTTDVNSVLLKTIELLSYELRVSNIELVTALSPIPQTMADPHQLQQVFLNLIVNAEQAMLEGHGRGRLSVTSSVMDQRIEVRFEDDGPGISEENLLRIFDPFFTTKPIGKGTGLGLSICQGIVAEHGGRLTAYSTPGSGARFVVDLPIIRLVHKTEQAKHEPGPQIGQKSVLVVDDEEQLREVFAQILSSDGHRIRTATNGAEAIDLVRRERFDLVIADIKMPEADGREFYRHLKSEGHDIAQKLLFVTGDVMNTETIRFIESTGNPWIAKPFEVDAVRAAINRALASKSA